MKKPIALVMTLVLLLGTLLAGCNNQPAGSTPTDSTPLYQVTVKDALGTPYTSGVIVRFMQNGTQVAMQPVDEAGVAAKELNAGDYTVELMFTDGKEKYHYNKEGLTLSATKVGLDVQLAYAPVGEPTVLTAGGVQSDAYAVNLGCTYVTLTAGKRNYFLFAPKVAGTYEFSVPGSSAAIGYYGSTHFVQETSAAEVMNNKFTISVNAGMVGTAENGGGNVFVIGLDADANTTGATLAIRRAGEAEWTIADEPWTIYQAKKTPTAYTLPAGTTTTPFDLTAADYKLVLDGNGFYHLNTADGPLVLMSLGKDTKYISCYKEITDHTGVNKYFYDGDKLTKDSFIRKEDYTACLLQYIECMDEESGMYPLTEDLKYIVQQHGDHQGWWNENGKNYIFVDENGNRAPGINADIAWLLMCYYTN